MTNEEKQEIQTRKDIEARIIAKAWKDEGYKQQLLTNPKVVIEQEFGVEIPEEVNIQVTEESSNSLYLVLPIYPEVEGEELSEQDLEVLAGGRRYRIARNDSDWRGRGREFNAPMKTGTKWRQEITKDFAKTIVASIAIDTVTRSVTGK